MAHREPGVSLAARTLILAGLLAALAGGVAHGQHDHGSFADGSPNLRDLLTNFLGRGITLARPAVGTDHSAHFIGSEQPQFQALVRMNAELADQLSSFPLTSSAGGFSYQFDPALGVFQRQSKSFGPVYAERALTLGRGRWNIGLNYSQFTYNTLDDLDLKNGDMKLVFTHSDTNEDGSNLYPFVEGDIVTSTLYLDLRTRITALVATYGIADHVDVSLAVPVVSVEVDASSQADVQHLATADSLQGAHLFENGTSTANFRESGDASGLGDLVVRAKTQLLGRGRALLGLLGELALPTGEEENLLGTGRVKAKGTLIGTWNHEAVAPHAGIGYIVAEGNAPDELTYAVGCDVVIDPKTTFAVDLLGRLARNVHRFRIEQQEYQANRNPAGAPPDVVTAVYPRLTESGGENRHELEGSVGFKVNLVAGLLLTGNGLFALTREGLVDGFTPLIGIDYSF
jgi:hypothetical protein